MKNKLIKIVALFSAMLTMGLADAKSYSSGGGGSSRSFSSGGGGKSFSSSSSSSKSYGSSSKSYTSNSSSNSSKSYTTNSSKTSKPSAPVFSSKAEKARYESATKSGKAFTTQADAVKDFKAKNANTYTSKYDKEPSKRPEHIPQTYTADGKSYSITYNQNAGGYGYWNGGGPGLGTFILYDMMSDAIMMNAMMSHQGYYVGNAPVAHGGGFVFFMVVVVVVIVGAIAWSVCREKW